MIATGIPYHGRLLMSWRASILVIAIGWFLTDKVIETTNWYSGDDGIYASIRDAARFLDLLLIQENILSSESIMKMKKWNDLKNPDYGLGLMIDKSFPYGVLYGHSGRGIGATTELYYFPKQEMIVGIFSNSGIRSTSKSFAKTYYKMRNKIVLKLFLF